MHTTSVYSPRTVIYALVVHSFMVALLPEEIDGITGRTPTESEIRYQEFGP